MHLHVVLAVAGLDLLQIAFQHRAAVIDQADRVAQPLHLVHAMSGEQNRLAGLLQLDQHILQHDGVGGIEPGERLVHDDQIGIVQQRGDELNLLLHALGQLFHFLLRPVADLQPLAPCQRALARFLLREIVQAAEKDQVIEHLHPLVEPALLGQIADAMRAAGDETSRRTAAPRPRRAW